MENSFGNLIIDLSPGIQLSLASSYLDSDNKVKFQPLNVFSSEGLWIAQQPDATKLLNIILVEMTDSGPVDANGILKPNTNYYFGADQAGIMQMDSDGFYFQSNVDLAKAPYINIPMGTVVRYNDNKLTNYIFFGDQVINNVITDGPVKFSLSPIVEVEGAEYINLNEQMIIGGQEVQPPDETEPSIPICRGCVGKCYGPCPAGQSCSTDIQGFYRCVKNTWFKEYNNIMIAVICMIIIVILMIIFFSR